MKEPTRRQRLLEFAETGRLRNQLEGRTETDVVDLIVDICLRYCERRRRSRGRAPKGGRAA